MSVPADLRHQHLEEIDRTLIQVGRASKSTTLIAKDETIRANLPSLLLHLGGHKLRREPEELAYFEIIRVRTDVQLSSEEAKLD